MKCDKSLPHPGSHPESALPAVIMPEPIMPEPIMPEPTGGSSAADPSADPRGGSADGNADPSPSAVACAAGAPPRRAEADPSPEELNALVSHSPAEPRLWYG